jgi:hypothetical protein
MSFEEKNTWLYGLITAVVPTWYFATVLAQVRERPAGEIDYIGAMLGAIGIAIAANIAGTIVVAIASAAVSGEDADRSDERDKSINRFGDYWAYYVLSAGVAGALILTFVQAEHFWIANAIYLAFVLASLTSVTLKLYAYRRGF